MILTISNKDFICTQKLEEKINIFEAKTLTKESEKLIQKIKLCIFFYVSDLLCPYCFASSPLKFLVFNFHWKGAWLSNGLISCSAGFTRIRFQFDSLVSHESIYI